MKDTTMLVPASLTPSGLGIYQRDYTLGVSSGCCDAYIRPPSALSAGKWFCATCRAQVHPSRPRMGAVTNTARGAGAVHEWLVFWTGWAAEDLKVSVRIS